MSKQAPSDQDREAFIAAMQNRMKQAQQRGASPEEIQAAMRELVQQEEQVRAPQMIASLRSWLRGLRNAVIVGILAVSLAIGLALLVEQRYAAPLCKTYGAQHGLVYTGLDYPILGGSGGAGSNTSGECLFRDSAGQKQLYSLGALAPNFPTDFLMSAALQLELTIPVAFVVIALIVAILFRRSTA